MKRGLIPAVAGAIAHAAMPSLLLRQNPTNRVWSWKRTNTRWHGRFATETEARADAERCGLRKPYLVERVWFEDAP